MFLTPWLERRYPPFDMRTIDFAAASEGNRAARKSRFRALPVALAMLAASAAGCRGPQNTIVREASAAPGIEAADWDGVFVRAKGWTGADGAYSVDLRDGRTLWIFNDTWIGRVVNGKHASGSRLINNSIAVHPTPPAGSGRPPAAEEFTFLWGPSGADGAPSAWIVPDLAVLPGRGQAAEAGDSRGWYWPRDGAVVPGAREGPPRLVLFLEHIGKKAGDQSVWGFKGIGGALAVINNVRNPVREWRAEQFRIPYAVAADRAVREVNWGAAVHFEEVAPATGGGYLYIYGIKETDPLNKQLLLARAPADRVEQFDTWRFRAADGRWSAEPSDAAAIAEHLVNELTVERIEIAGRPAFVMVHSEPVFGRRILVRTADRPEGPWSEPVPIYTVPGVAKNATYFTYAAKGHGHLSGAGELLVSYVINSNDFWAMAGDAEIYRPRFIRLRFENLIRTP